jgi:hypothetical protein
MKIILRLLVPLLCLTLVMGCSGRGTRGLSSVPGSISSSVFTISGNASGGSSGTTHVEAYTSKTVLNSGTLVSSTSLATPGAYSISAPVGGTYYVRAYRDANANGVYDYPEAYAWYGGSVAASANAITTTTNANITMVVPAAPPAVPATFTMSGNISGGTSGTYYISAFTSTTVLNGTTYIAGTTLAGPGSYSLTLPAGGTYYINAYRDENSNSTYNATDSSGWYGGSVAASANAVTTTTNGNIFVVTPPIAPAKFTITGTISGGTSGVYYISAFSSNTVVDNTTYTGGVTVNAAGAFSFKVPVGGTYYINAYRDESGNSNYDNGESSAWYGSGYFATGATTVSTTTNIGSLNLVSTFMISGAISGGTAGSYYVNAYSSSTTLNNTTWRGGVVTSGPSYSFYVPVGGTYYVQALRDTNGSTGYDSGEPTAFYGGLDAASAIPVSSTIAGANIAVPTYFNMTVNITDLTASSGNFIVTLWQNGNYTGWLGSVTGASSTQVIQVPDTGSYYISVFRDSIGNNSAYDTGEPSSAVAPVSFATPAGHNLNLLVF